jgi:hypothetical protein
MAASQRAAVGRMKLSIAGRKLSVRPATAAGSPHRSQAAAAAVATQALKVIIEP